MDASHQQSLSHIYHVDCCPLGLFLFDIALLGSTWNKNGPLLGPNKSIEMAEGWKVSSKQRVLANTFFLNRLRRQMGAIEGNLGHWTTALAPWWSSSHTTCLIWKVQRSLIYNVILYMHFVPPLLSSWRSQRQGHLKCADVSNANFLVPCGVPCQRLPWKISVLCSLHASKS